MTSIDLAAVIKATPVVSLEDKLALVKRKIDKTSHISVDQEGFNKSAGKEILFLCPAKVYERNEETGECVVNFENCLECGTCRVACREFVKWDNPQGGFGVSYSFG